MRRFRKMAGLALLTILLFGLDIRSAGAQVCDVDMDGDIDRDDIWVIFSTRNTPSNGPDDPRDADGDGIVTINDGRFCVLQCTLPYCVIPPSNIAPSADAGPDQNVEIGTFVTMDGSASSDPDSGPSPLTFLWTFMTIPPLSNLTDNDITNSTSAAPTFLPDVDGSYVFILVVSDGNLSDDDQVIITATVANVAPNADAGVDQNVEVGTVAHLDGSNSVDPDNAPSPLTFLWTLITIPSTSNLTDSDIISSTTAIPSLIPDVEGSYSLNLMVDDGDLSDMDRVLIIATLPNVAPNADAGLDQNVRTGREVTLDGSFSVDPDKGPMPLTFLWIVVSVPPGSILSNADILNPTTSSPGFTPDIDGTYVLRLEVHDGDLADTDQVMIIAGNAAPIAVDNSYPVNEDQSLSLSAPGILSNDIDTDGDPLTAVLIANVIDGILVLNSDGSFSYTPQGNFNGTDTFMYRVDDGDLSSNVATVTITVNPVNDPPIADAGLDQIAYQGQIVTLDGSGSSDQEGDLLTFQWSFVSIPTGSQATLLNATTVNPSFEVDIAGPYEAQLIVNDGLLDSLPDTVTIIHDRINIRLLSPSDGEVLSTPSTEVSGTVSDSQATVEVNGREANVLNDGSFSLIGFRLAEGLNRITAQATNPLGQTDSDTIEVIYQPSPVPLAVIILSPEPGSILETLQIRVMGIVSDPRATVLVDDTLARVEDNRFEAIVNVCEEPLVAASLFRRIQFEGNSRDCTIIVKAYSIDGASTIRNIPYTYFPALNPLTVLMTDPLDDAVFTYSPIQITGEVNDVLSGLSPTVITVNGVPATLQGSAFTVSIFLEDGINDIIAHAQNAGGGDAYDTIRIIHEPDTKPLSVSITSPVDNVIVNVASIAVSGLVSDSTASVQVNGVDADQDVRSFSIFSIPLSIGNNSFTAMAQRPNGETTTASVTVTYDPNYASPPAPLLSQLPEYVRTSHLGISGLTLPLHSAEVFVNGSSRGMTPADSQGLFSTTVLLSEGVNHISARAIDSFGNQSALSTEAVVIRDTINPYIQQGILLIDRLNLAVSRVLIAGKTEALAEVLIAIDDDPDYEYQMTADDQGRFGTYTHLSAGEHLVSIRFTDLAGNIAGVSETKTIHPPYSRRPLPPAIDPMPTPIQETVVTVEGNAYAGFWVEVLRNNELMGTALTDHQGRFKLDGVNLIPGQNILMARQLSKRVDLGDRLLTLDPIDSEATIVEIITGTPTRPNVTIEFPVNGAETDASFLPLRGAVSGSSGRLRLNAYYYEGNGYALPQNGKFVSSHKVPLLPGENTLWVEATASDGTRGIDKIIVFSRREAEVPSVQITAPTEGQEVFDPLISVFGLMEDTVQTVIINEQEAAISDGSFSTSELDIFNPNANNPDRGRILITAWAMNAKGQIGHHDVPLRYRFIPTPEVFIISPGDGEIVASLPVTVTGNVMDASEVTVNGVPAEIDENTFTAEINLEEGLNTINAIAANSVKAATDTIQLTYQPGAPITLQSLAIDPPVASVPLGDSLQIRAIGTYSNGDTVDLTLDSVWASSNTNVAAVNTGLVSGKGLGIVTLTAILDGLTGTIAVSVVAPVLQSIQVVREGVSGALITGDPVVTIGETLSFKALGSYRDNSVVDITSLVTWISGDPTVVTIDSSGMAMGISNGIVQISASYQSVTGNNTLTVLPPALYLFIDSPTEGSTINRENVMVTGTIISQAQEVGITVNGVIANVFGNQVTANGVFLVEGGNDLIAQAIDSNGAQAQAQITVDAITTDPQITLTSNIASGIAPLNVSFRILSTFSFTSSTLTYAGPGAATITAINEAEYQVSLDTEGVYFLTAEVVDDQSIVHTDTIGITVLNLAELDALLQSKWEGMKQALFNLNINGGLENIAEDSKPKYESLFNRFGNQLSGIAANLPDLQLIRIVGDVAVYYMIKVENGIEKAHFIYFGRDANGIWKLQSF